MVAAEGASGTASPRNLAEIVDQLIERVEGETVSLADLLSAMGGRSHGALLTLPALLAVIPVISAIPGISMTTAVIIMLVSLQIVVSPRRVWLPQRLLKLSFSKSRLEQAVGRLRPWIGWTRRWMKPRLAFLTEEAMHRQIAAITALLGMAMFVLSLAPFGVTPPALAVLFFGLGLMIRDGFLIIAGSLLAAVTVCLLALFWRMF